MSEFESLIPTFEVGQRVRVLDRPVEWACPKCGRTLSGGEFFGVLIVLNTTSYCPSCLDTPVNGEGWHSVHTDDGEYFAVPYTLLEPIPIIED